ncbi:P-loop containing nucleoside triphosphate hydrolase protein [Ramicandelaber brevisporus]|nr:P-loop containing nucleoside triphosphate hydrolase protein [Ramicandelaber brevisporus]
MVFVNRPEIAERLRIHKELHSIQSGRQHRKEGSEEESLIPHLSSEQLRSELWDILRHEVWLLTAVAASAVAAAALGVYAPVATGDLINSIANNLGQASTAPAAASSTAMSLPGRLFSLPRAMASMNAKALKLLGLFVIQAALTTTHISLVSLLGVRVSRRLHNRVFHALMHGDIDFFDRNSSSVLLTRLTTDVEDFTSTFKKLVTQGLRAMTLTVGSIVQLVRISPQLTVAMASTLPLVYIGMSMYGVWLREMRRVARWWEGVANGIAGESISNIRTVRVFAAEGIEEDLYKSADSHAAAAQARFGVHMAIFRGLTNLSIGCMVLSVLYYGGALVADGQMRAGELMAYMLSMQNAQKALDALGGLMGHTVRANAAMRRVFELANVKPKVTSTNGIVPSSVQGSVRFVEVGFAYPSRPEQPVLSGFNLSVPAGKVVALCGSSGSGKSTVASLLARFYDVTQGGILVDGIPLQHLDPQFLRGKAIGFINQEPVLFATSIRENIRYGKPNATDAEILEVARLAHVDTFVSEFPGGYDTVLGERTGLSGGQKQRIAIARALLRDPRILVLDEATSALDAQSEKVVQESLERLMQGRTTLIIAHRLSTIRNADHIVVMGKVPGQIVEQGTHEELMKLRGAYYKLYNQHVNNAES